MAPNSQCRIRIIFQPSAPGPALANFTVIDSGRRLLRSGMVSGTDSVGAAPALAWAATPDFVFGQVTIGQAAQRSARLVNASSVSTVITRLRVTGPNASRLTLAANCAPNGCLEAAPAAMCSSASRPRRPGWWKAGSRSRPRRRTRRSRSCLPPAFPHPLSNCRRRHQCHQPVAHRTLAVAPVRRYGWPRSSRLLWRCDERAATGKAAATGSLKRQPAPA